MQRDEDEGVDTLADSIRAEKGGEVEEQEETEGTEAEEAEEQEETEGSEADESEGEEGEEAEEAAGPDESEEEEEEPEERVEGKGRAPERIRRQSEEIRRLRADNERLQRERGGGGTATRPTQVDPQAMRKAVTDDLKKALGEGGLALMTPEQQANFLTGTVERLVSPVLRQIAGSVGANQDRQVFKEKYGSDPKTAPFFKRFQNDVESKFAEAQSQGYFIPREQFFKEMVAEAVMKGLEKGGAQQRRQRDIRKIKAGGSPTKGRGDVGGKRGKETRLGALEKRLDGVKI